MRLRFVWQILPAFFSLILLTLLLLTWLFARNLSTFYLEETAAGLEARARLAAFQIADSFALDHSDRLDELSIHLSRETGTRFTFVLPSGAVLADSLESPELMENHALRPEVAIALTGTIGQATRYSNTVHKNMMYVAIPVHHQDQLVGVVRAALPVTTIDQTLGIVYRQIIVSGIVVMLIATLIGTYISRRISRPLEEMRRGAERFARGELTERLRIKGSIEITALATAMNTTAYELDQRMRTVVRQHNEQEAVLASMVEGVLAVDTSERIIRINRAAATLLGVSAEEVKGRSIQESIRKADLQRFVRRALSARDPVEGDIVLHGNEDLYLQAHGSLLRGESGQELGALIVLNDVTRLRRLENVRRDFVANVSHELKTPITAIKGFVETLQEGAIADPDSASQFLEIMMRQADRLNDIIDDLLILARIEQDSDQQELPLVEMSLAPVITAAVQASANLAAEKQLQIESFCPAALRAPINAPLLEQALINLLTNAIKYSPEQGRVLIETAQSDRFVTISVRDWGCGIDKVHLPRLFERFYRADKARSRKLGGTGLGLAIVKHIAQAHGGEVSVTSTPGEGSTFSLQIPLKAQHHNSLSPATTVQASPKTPPDQED
ncbi:sensor histidine kinase [Pelovirga terrestris]|nr:ATP-binding protein [Pelovirga terrestris]